MGTRTQAKTSSRSRWFEIRSRTVILLSIMDRIVSFLDKLRRENGDVKFFFFRIACKNILKYRQNFVLNLFIDPYIPCLYLSPDSSDSSDSSNSFSDTLLERTIQTEGSKQSKPPPNPPVRLSRGSVVDESSNINLHPFFSVPDWRSFRRCHEICRYNCSRGS